jgi:hypothetical protein
MKQTVEYGPKAPGYEKKSLSITRIAASNGEMSVVNGALCDLGKELVMNDRLSVKQKENLYDALISSKVLDYCNSFVESGLDPTTVDGVRWDIEEDRSSQVEVIKIAWMLLYQKLKPLQKLELFVSLFNKAHIASSKKFDHDSFNEDYHLFNAGLLCLQKNEKQLFEERESRARLLVEMGLFHPDDLDPFIEAEDVETMKNQVGYDAALLLSNLLSFDTSQSMSQARTALQEVLYLGFATAVRDTNTYNNRED